MRALVVGAGAVGQVYGRHLALGGAEVAFLVRDKYVEEMRRGLTFYPLNRSGRRRRIPEEWRNYEVLTGREVAGGRWDQVYITVPSTALRGPWLDDLARDTGDATIVLLTPGIDDRTFVASKVGEARLVCGMITLISYHAPLPGETRFPEPGMAYWFPPASPAPTSGPADRRREVVRALRAGRLPATAVADVSRIAAYGTAMLIPLLVALERADWKFERFFSRAERPFLRTAFAATREASAVVRRRVGPPPLRLAPLPWLARPSLLRAGLRLARPAVPLDLETYLSVHFTKVGDQTRAFLAGYVDHARDLGIPAPALQALVRASVQGTRGGAGVDAGVTSTGSGASRT